MSQDKPAPSREEVEARRRWLATHSEVASGVPIGSERSFRGMMWRARNIDRAAAYVVEKNAELYRRLAERPTESTPFRGIHTKETEETK